MGLQLLATMTGLIKEVINRSSGQPKGEDHRWGELRENIFWKKVKHAQTGDVCQLEKIYWTFCLVATKQIISFTIIKALIGHESTIVHLMLNEIIAKKRDVEDGLVRSFAFIRHSWW